MFVNHLFSATVSPDKPLLYFAEHDTQLTNIALDPSSSKPSSSTTAVEPVIVKIEYEGPKIEGENSDEEDEIKEDKMKDDEDEDDEEGDDTGYMPMEKKEVVICSLIPGQILQAQVNLVLNMDDQYRFRVVGGAYNVHLLGHYIAQEGRDVDLSPSEGSDIYSDEEDELDADELGKYDERDLLKRAKLGLLEGAVDSEEESDEDYDSEDESEGEDEGRIQELIDDVDELADEAASASPPKLTNGTAAPTTVPTTAGKKRPLVQDVIDEAAGDVSMASVGTTGSATLEGADMSKLSKNQRKKLAKKLKAANGEAVPPPTSSVTAAVAEEASAPPAASEKETKKEAKKESRKEKKEAKKEARKEAEKEAKGAKEESKESTKSTTVTLPSGLKYDEHKPGSGPSCKNGQKVSMRYIGKLPGGKTFDKNVAGEPFRFTLGKGEVIQGWDLGVKGMKVGGERKLTVPAELAYGKRGAPPDIPPNATLIFDVKLLKIN